MFEGLSTEQLLERGVTLSQAVRTEKIAVWRHRENLRKYATELRQLEEHCQRLGIRLIVVSSNQPKA